MNQRPKPSETTNQPSPASCSPTPASGPSTMTAPPPSPTTIALSIMLVHRHPFNSFKPCPFHSPHQQGIKIPPQHVFGQPTPLPPPAPKSRLRLLKMADRAFSQYTRKRETVFPNPYKEDLYSLEGYFKDVRTYTGRASWDFGGKMPRPGRFKSAWTGAAVKREKEMEEDMGYDGCDEREEQDHKDINDEADDKASGQSDWETDDEEDSGIGMRDEFGECPRGRSTTMRPCTNGLDRC